MPRDVSQVFRNELYSPSMRVVPLVTIDITHPSIHPQVIRLVNNNQNIVWDGNTYLASSFNFTPPMQEESSAQDASISIQNIDRGLVELVRTIEGKPKIVVNIVIASDDVVREAGPFSFLLGGVTYNKDIISGSLTYDIRPTQILSTLKYSVSLFPGLVQ